MADPRQGGSLSDMAPTGTSIPSDTGTQRTIPSKPNPHQAAPDQSGGTDLAGAADNATDIPRSGRDVGSTGEVVTAYGDSMPAEIETKRLGMQSGSMDAAKGHPRDEHHRKQKGATEERLAGEGPNVQAAPGEESLDQDTLRDRRE